MIPFGARKESRSLEDFGNGGDSMEGVEKDVVGGKKGPVQCVRLGRVTVTVWENKLENGGSVFSYVPERSYKDAGGVWKSSSSFSRSEVGDLVRALEYAVTVVEVAR